MVAIKANQADKFVAKPDTTIVAALVYGPDDGLVSERATSLARALSGRDGDGGEIIRVEEADLDGNPDRLVVELQTIPMFGGGKVVRTSSGRRINAALFKNLFAAGAPAAGLVCEAGNLKASDALRKLFEAQPWAAAVPCYSDSDRDLAALANNMINDAGLAIDKIALDVLVSRLGADRALSRGEIEKLILYVHGRQQVKVDDIEAIVGDAADSGLEAIASAAASGLPDVVVAEMDAALASGENPQAIIIVALRYFQRLHRIKAATSSGKSPDEVIRTLRPPLHFSLKQAVTSQCRLWSTASLTEALSRINDTAREARIHGAMDGNLAERLLFNLAQHAARRR